MARASAPGFSISSLLAGVALFATVSPLLAAEAPNQQVRSGQPWLDMDYGPFLTASIEAPAPATNIAYKGIAIRLCDQAGREAEQAVVFDTDLLRYAAGWTGGFVALKGVVFDGEHWAYPRIGGRQVFGNPMGPGWARDGRFDDPRAFPYGPLPRDWAHWQGLYLHGPRVVLKYSVGDAQIRELPAVEKRGDLSAFSRSFEIGPHTNALTLQVAAELGASLQVLDRVSLRSSSGTEAAATIACLVPPAATESRPLAGTPAVNEPLLAAVVDSPAGAKWELSAGGHLRLTFPPSAKSQRFKVLLSRSVADSFSPLLEGSTPPERLEPLTRGGPPRWPQTLTTAGKLGAETGPFAGDTITAPADNPWNSWMRFGGFDFFRDATRAAICTWSGDVWLVSGMDERLEQLHWRRFATGLFQPLGLKIVDDQIYVLGRDQITRLHDLNGDGEADYYENFNNDTLTTEHFHEFAVDLQTDAAGNFYYMKCARHARDALHPHHGSLVKISRDGRRTEILANGFRAPNGLAVTAAGEFYSTDQEGHWMPANRLNRIERGKFYGNVWSWFPDGKPTRYDEPICWIHPRVDRSPSTMAVVTSDRWGLPKNTLLSLSYGVGRIFVVPTQTVEGRMQGGVTPLPLEFDTGIMRARFSPRDGQLYTCGLYGWAGNKTQAGGFYRVRYTGQPLRLPVQLHVVANGALLTFTDPLDPAAASDPASYQVERWNYQWTANYGSPDFKLNGEPGRDRLEIASARVSADGRTVFLEMPDIRPAMQMHIQMDLRTADGAKLQTYVHHTIHRVPTERGEDRLGDALPAAAPPPRRQLAAESPGLINRFYSTQIGAWGRSDARRARLVALNVPADTAPTPFVPPGRFTATWEGYLKAESSDEYHFFAWGRGRVWLKINDAEAIPPSEATPAEVGYPPVRLPAGLNRLELTYESAPDGHGLLRLFWKSASFPWEPVPPTAFVFDAAEGALKEGEARRLGRQLFASRLCVNCHDPGTLISGDAMPELSTDAPALDDSLPDLRPDWLVRYLQDPRLHPDGWMPFLLRGSPDQVRRDAADIAAFLDTLITPYYRETARAPLPAGLSARGAELFSKTGCVACHVLPGDPTLPNESRLPLA
ncbi:MAG: hypothetical protein IPM17_14150, partial [Verrucomicrobia bacterium]|nr:hypothetical protein [Verrucomicrobiota bacterium]